MSRESRNEESIYERTAAQHYGQIIIIIYSKIKILKEKKKEENKKVPTHEEGKGRDFFLFLIKFKRKKK